ncbi:hypothetical protein V6957_003760 [Vibrio parahaemolyticus]|jgi:hypothetical protein|uniref:Uncharacterized protein n=4 Tax=Vibrio TaxID=662 RepID=A0A7Z1MD48_9VIBR|nr:MULTISPECIES: hypothetical protein [Vibrionaceae]APU90735.1 hypothetical protein [Vibrio alginolyticus]APU91605.1 hypothetical protein [Vibrio parahaemolyticus]EGQ9728242.1 hypothetical protein [Vibrio cholerae]EGR1271149.1 hypothetical protein [Vibrio parahaemolyticus]EGR2699449.1 hypothetical protein [Vibrio parahaemolyticus]
MAAKFIEFDSQKEAINHRAKAGGWIFSAFSGKAIWFNTTFTPHKILYHRAVRGLSGEVI